MPYEKYIENKNQEIFNLMTDEDFEKLIKKIINSDRVTERWTKGLGNLLKHISEETNEKLDTKLLDLDGTIRMNSFSIGEGGPYRKEEKEFKEDKSSVKRMEERWGRELNQTAEEFLKKREWKHGSLWEKAVTVIFNKILKENFVVVRASKFDDYKNGIDTLIIDKDTGEVICAFDEVSAREESDIDMSKHKKVEEQDKNGGAEIKYGITFREGKLIKETIKNVPVFSLRLSGEELIEILQKMNFDSPEKISESELNLFDKLIASLEKQIEDFQNIEIIKNKKEDILKSLDKMKKIRDEKFPNIKSIEN